MTAQMKGCKYIKYFSIFVLLTSQPFVKTWKWLANFNASNSTYNRGARVTEFRCRSSLPLPKHYCRPWVRSEWRPPCHVVDTLVTRRRPPPPSLRVRQRAPSRGCCSSSRHPSSSPESAAKAWRTSTHESCHRSSRRHRRRHHSSNVSTRPPSQCCSFGCKARKTLHWRRPKSC